MKRVLLILTLALGINPAVGRSAESIRFVLTVSPSVLVADEALYATFAAVVGATVESLLGEPAAVDDPATLRMLLSTRVHLAHDRGDEQLAVATAAWIRSLQGDPSGRAFAGLTTFATVAARRELAESGETGGSFERHFAREFSLRLAALPRDAAMVKFLHEQHAKIHGLTREALEDEVRNQLEPAIGPGLECTLQQADALVRVRHRLENILPVRSATLRALKVAIAERETATP